LTFASRLPSAQFTEFWRCPSFFGTLDLPQQHFAKKKDKQDATQSNETKQIFTEAGA
jgi:hypothetical protein